MYNAFLTAALTAAVSTVVGSAEIIRQHEKHTERRYCPLYAKEAMVKVYDAYHALGGNGMMTKFYNEIIALPEEPQQKED